MAFTPKPSPNLLDYCYPCENGGHLLGDDLNSLHELTKSMPSPLVNNFLPDNSWGYDVFTDTNAVQQSTYGEPHPFGHAFPVVSGSVPSLLSLLFNSGGQPIPWTLGSLFQLAPTILSSVPPTSTPPRSDPVNEGRTDEGKGKARAVDSDDTDQPGPVPAPMEDEIFADALREAMTASRRAGCRVRSPDEAGPSGSSASTLTLDVAPFPSKSTSLPQTHPSASDSEQAEINHAILMSTIEHIEYSLHALRANFTFPIQLDFHLPLNADPRASSPINEDINGYITTYLPATSANSTVSNFIRDLRGLLRQLDNVDSRNDVEAESMKEKVVGAINGVLENVESEVEEAIGKGMSLQATGVDVVGR